MTTESSPGAGTNSEATWKLVDSPKELSSLCESLRSAGCFALDMEFRRDKTYFARLDLVQVATPEFVAIIDPQKAGSLDPLWELIGDPAVEVVVHSGRQDLEILKEAGGPAPRNVFDTQVAASFLGFGDQVPYNRLLAAVLGRQILKLETTSDWSRRPLSEAQIEYAIDDVRDLPELRRQLGERLSEAGRAEWAAQEMTRLEQSAATSRDPATLWKLVAGSSRLRGRQMDVLRELAAWRESLARRRNLPRKWVVPDDVLVDIAKRMPRKLDDISSIQRLSSTVLEREGPAILECVTKASAAPAKEPSQPDRRDPAVSAAADMLELLLRIRGEESGVATPLLGTRSEVLDVVRWVRGESQKRPPLLDGWRGEIVGGDLVALASGIRSLRFEPGSGKVVLEPAAGQE
ncbi:MAG TPA: ribonuclease D [Actinomycetota bacterium]|nr:ribonuclease D [Actinomycetota bacterium]